MSGEHDAAPLSATRRMLGCPVPLWRRTHDDRATIERHQVQPDVSLRKALSPDLRQRAGEDSLKRHAKELEDFLSAKTLRPLSPPTYAFYNPPWTLPFLRRNEVLVEIPASSP